MKEKLHERALITCVIMLAVCVVFKLFGADWFDLNTEIPILQRADDIILKNNTLSFVYCFITTYISGYLIIATTTCKRNKSVLFLSCISVLLSMVIDKYINISYICLISDFILLYIACLLIEKHCTKRFLIVVFLNIFYQMISIYLRSVEIRTSYYDGVTAFVLNIDYYIMLIITYLVYGNGGKLKCGVQTVSFSSLRKKLSKTHTANSSPSLDKGADHE